MRPFRFRLERLLRLKLAEKRQCAVALGRARHELGRREEDLLQARQQREGVTSSYARLAGVASRPADWIIAQNALNTAHRRVLERQAAVSQAQAKVEEARLRLVEQSREVEVYQRLRRREWEEYSLEVRRAGQKEIDAVATEQFSRRTDASR